MLSIGVAHSQSIKDGLQGDWLCLKILDAAGQPAQGKFGASDEYLKFSFIRNKFRVAEAPFDTGFDRDFTLTEGRKIDVFVGARVPNLPERFYEVQQLDSVWMILATTAPNGRAIKYHFINQKNFPASAEGVIDHGLLLIKHIRYSNIRQDVSRNAEYHVSNDQMFLRPSPTFESGTSGEFGHHLSNRIRLPEDFPANKLSEEMVVEFTVDADGASDLTMTKGIMAVLDEEVLQEMKRLAKYWNPVVLDGKKLTTRSRMHLYFIMPQEQ